MGEDSSNAGSLGEHPNYLASFSSAMPEIPPAELSDQDIARLQHRHDCVATIRDGGSSWTLAVSW
jgi:hypothetical protein